MALNNKSLYSQYVLERENARTVENKIGFAVWSWETVQDEKAIYVSEIYIVPEQRKKGAAKTLMNACIDAARKERIEPQYIIGSVDITTNGAERSMRAALGYGLRFSHIANNIIYMYKEIV